MSKTVVRACLFAFGAAAIVWGASVFPVLWGEAAIERVAAHIVEGHVFLNEDWADVFPPVTEIESTDYCRPAAARASAIVRLRMMEDAELSAQGPNVLDTSLATLRKTVRQSLACVPGDAFLWVIDFWVGNTVDGFSPGRLSSLRMSYVTGPNEGWVALKRSPFALALYETLPPKIADMAATELVALIKSGFVRQSANIFITSGWRNRQALLARLAVLPMPARQAFAHAVYDAGGDIEMPGIRRPEWRPWR